MTITQSIRMAKASPAEVENWRKFFDQLQTMADDYDMDEAQLGAWVIEQLSALGSIERILLGYETLVANVCDPSLDYLAWKPEINIQLPKGKTNHD